MILAEDIKAEIPELAVESRIDLSYLACYDALQRLRQSPVIILHSPDVFAPAQTICVAAPDYVPEIILLFLFIFIRIVIRFDHSCHFQQERICYGLVFFHRPCDLNPY